MSLSKKYRSKFSKLKSTNFGEKIHQDVQNRSNFAHVFAPIKISLNVSFCCDLFMSHESVISIPGQHIPKIFIPSE